MSCQPNIAQKTPFPVELLAGQTYYWCSCGLSKSQPGCDGSHTGTGCEPIAHTAAESGKVWLCGCKQSKNPPFCDGSHSAL